MPRFEFKAKAGPDKVVEDELLAETREAALTLIAAKGYVPIWVREEDTDNAGAFQTLLNRTGRPADIDLFTRQLASLTRAGVPILRALETIEEQTEGKRFRRVVHDLHSAVRDGRQLSEALQRWRNLFPPVYVSMVRAGESGGVLDTILRRLADSREREADFTRRIQSATAYPLFTLLVGLATIILMLTVFLPRIADLFDADAAGLPLPTRLLLNVSDFFAAQWAWGLAAMLAVSGVYLRLNSWDKGRAFLDRIRLQIPLVGGIIRRSEIARFAHTLALLLSAGTPIEQALALSGDTLRNAVLRTEIERVREDTVRQGFSIASGLRRSRQFPALVVNLVAVGEEGGQLEDCLQEIATFYEKECDHRLRFMMNLLEPALILLVGLVVGFVVLAMLLPIFEMGRAVGR